MGSMEFYLALKLAADKDLQERDVLIARSCHEDGELVKCVAGGNLEHLEWVKEEAQLVLWKTYGILTPYTLKYAEGEIAIVMQ